MGLPGGISMRVAARRCTRVGSRSGIPVEDYGVVTDMRYFMTKEDVVSNNQNLKAAAAKFLKALPNQALRLTSDPAEPHQKFSVECSNIDRIDLFVNDRPTLSSEVPASQSHVPVRLPFPAPGGSVVSANGYRKGEFVVSTRVKITS